MAAFSPRGQCVGMAVLWAGEMSKSLGSEDVAGTTDPVFFWGVLGSVDSG